jgi:hypothetical protein
MGWSQIFTLVFDIFLRLEILSKQFKIMESPCVHLRLAFPLFLLDDPSKLPLSGKEKAPDCALDAIFKSEKH